MATIEVLDPTVQPDSAGIAALGAGSLSGTRVAFLNNGWTSWETMIVRLCRELREVRGGAAVGQWHIPISSAAPDELLDDVGEHADLVLAGLAN